jgi:hypothetical protein
MPGPKLERIELTPEEQAALEARGTAPDRTSCRGSHGHSPATKWTLQANALSFERAEGSAAPQCSNRTDLHVTLADLLHSSDLPERPSSTSMRLVCIQMATLSPCTPRASANRRIRS